VDTSRCLRNRTQQAPKMQRRSILCLLALAACLALASAQEPPKEATTEEVEKPKPKPKARKAEPCSFKGSAWKNSLSTTEKMWSGAFARLCSQTMLHPLDTIRTRRQAKGGLVTTWADCAKGIVPQMAGAMPAGALQFMAYESSKSSLNKLLANHTLGGLKPHVIEVCSASLGACAASIVRVPQERIKQPVQADMYPNWMAAINGNLEKGGVGGFFVGMKATLMRDVPWNALSFLFFNAFKMSYEAITNNAPTQQATMLLGAIGGGLAAIIMTPIDVVKTRLMLQVADKSGILPYSSIGQCLAKVAADEGPSALMKGLMPRVLYLGPLAAVTMAVYEQVGKVVLQRKGPDWCRAKPTKKKKSKSA